MTAETRGADERIERALAGGLFVVVAAVVAGTVLLAAGHADDRYGLDHVSGARMALARAFDEGQLYPELDGDSTVGGSRYMPLPIVVHGSLTAVTSDELVAGKLLSYVVMAALVGLVLVLLRRSGCPPAIAAGLAVLVVVTAAGQGAVHGMRADSLPLLLQLLALVVVERSTRTSALAAAAALCALAFLSKSTALWALVAIVVWLVARDRRRAVVFAATVAGLTAAGFLVFVAASDGRIVENVFGLAAAGITSPLSLVRGPYRMLQTLVEQVATVWLVLPAALAAVAVTLRRRVIDLDHAAFVVATAIAAVVLADRGTGANQLLDPVVLGAVVVGRALGSSGPAWVPLARRAALVALPFVLAGGAAVTIAPEVSDLLGDGPTYSAEPLDGVASSTTKILSDDPYVPLSLDQTPVVYDPFLFIEVAKNHPGVATRMIDRITRHEFELVVLVEPLDLENAWWHDYSLGIDVAAAIASSYELEGRVQGYWVYRPKR